MSADNITEGPWQSQHYFDMDGVRRIIGAIDGPDDGRFHYKVICEVDPDDSLDTKEQIANARMIAAAPELYEACQDMIGLVQLILTRSDLPPTLREALENSHRVEHARNAIAKAAQ